MNKMPTGNLPSGEEKLWEKVYEQAKSGSCKNNSDPEACAAKTAWSAVKQAGWSKDESGQWHKKAELTEFSLRITKASMDTETGEMRWLAVASDTDDDSYNDRMSMELFDDFIDRIVKGELAPDEFQSDFWRGGMPYLSVSHYYDLNGDGVPGMPEEVFIDGAYLKARGKYFDTPLGRACWKAVRKDLFSEKSKGRKDKVRISIAFLDWMHQHKSNGYMFERKSLDDLCPECIAEFVKGNYDGKIYLRGQLVHLAHTRVPVNKRTDIMEERSMTTRKQDAASIIGEDQAEELEEKSKLIGKSEALVIKDETQKDLSLTSTPEVVDKPIVEESKHMTEDEECAEGDEECMKKMKDKKMKEEKKSDFEKIFSAIEELKSLVTPKPETSHPLDAVLTKFKADYDAALNMADVTPDEKLQLIQHSFAEIGNLAVDTIKKSQVVEPKVSTENDMLAKFSDVLDKVVQRLDLMDAKLSNPIQQVVTQQTQPMVRHNIQTPKRTGIEQRSVMSEPTTDNPTPKLHELLRRTV
jgi:cation transport regulator ChaB